MSEDFDPMDFQRNSVGVLVVRVIRIKDIVRTLGCTEERANEVVREIRGETNADGSLAFVLPSQLAAWTYQRAGKSAGPLPFKSMLMADPGERADVLKRAASRAEQQLPAAPTRTVKSGRRKLLLSKREAAKLLGIDRSSTLNELIARGLLKTVVVNARVKVTRAEVERLAAVGFDVTRPAPATERRKPKATPSSWESPSKEILRIRL
jgi:hypothetical protein